jgi:hypothetical protein
MLLDLGRELVRHCEILQNVVWHAINRKQKMRVSGRWSTRKVR